MKCVCYATPQDHDLMRGFMNDCAPTLSAAAGHSGNNRPFFIRTVKDDDRAYNERERRCHPYNEKKCNQ